jgi:hypothetical protein
MFAQLGIKFTRGREGDALRLANADRAALKLGIQLALKETTGWGRGWSNLGAIIGFCLAGFGGKFARF